MPLSNLKNTITQTWPPRPEYTEANVPAGSQAGRVFIVTGGNAGIGFELCKILYASGATTYMCSRSEDKALKAISAIEKSIPVETPGRGQLRFIHLDLSDLESVKRAAQDFSSRENRLDVLWNNAGLGANVVKYGDRTAQGFESLIGIQCIGTLLFTKLLLGPLKNAAAADSPGKGNTRVIWLASGLIDSAAPPNGIDFSALQDGHKNRIENYAAAKAGAWILGREFARRYEKDGLVSLIVNPGNLKTDAFAGTSAAVMLIMNTLILREPIYGSYTELYAGLSPEISTKNNGSYIIPWGRLHPDADHKRQDIVKAMKSEQDGGLDYGKKFWTWCEQQWGFQVSDE